MNICLKAWVLHWLQALPAMKISTNGLFGIYFNYGLPLKKAGFVNFNTTYGGLSCIMIFTINFRGEYGHIISLIPIKLVRRFSDSFSTSLQSCRSTGPHKIFWIWMAKWLDLALQDTEAIIPFSFRIEEDFYANFKVLGFSSCVYIFANMGIISKNDIRPFTK